MICHEQLYRVVLSGFFKAASAWRLPGQVLFCSVGLFRVGGGGSRTDVIGAISGGGEGRGEAIRLHVSGERLSGLVALPPSPAVADRGFAAGQLGYLNR